MSRRRIVPGDGDRAHGTSAGYRAYGCRGECCRAATNADVRARVARNKARGLPIGHEAHGTARGYTYYGCRCRGCRDAIASYFRDYRERKAWVATGDPRAVTS